MLILFPLVPWLYAIVHPFRKGARATAIFSFIVAIAVGVVVFNEIRAIWDQGFNLPALEQYIDDAMKSLQ
jgi:hypothetical protein